MQKKLLGHLIFSIFSLAYAQVALDCPFNPKECSCTPSEFDPDPTTFGFVNCTSKSEGIPAFDVSSTKYTVDGLMQITGDLRVIPANHFAAFKHLEQLNLNQKTQKPEPAQINWHDAAFEGVTIRRLIPRRLDGVVPTPPAIKNIQGLQMLQNYENPTPLSIPDNAFSGMPKLISIYFIYSPIKGVNQNAFSGLENQLQTLQFIDNGLTDLSDIKPAIDGLRKIDWLVINQNKIGQIRRDDLPKLPLKKLWMSDNPISYIDNGAFANLNGVVDIWISNTALRLIDLAVFSDITTPESVDISLNENTQLRNLTASVTQFAPKYATIYLRGTALENIDTQVGTLLNKAPGLRIYIDGSVNLKCEGLGWMSKISCPGSMSIDNCKCADKNDQPLDEYLKSIDPDSKCRVHED